jgi:hypothetical protein
MSATTSESEENTYPLAKDARFVNWTLGFRFFRVCLCVEFIVTYGWKIRYKSNTV